MAESGKFSLSHNEDESSEEAFDTFKPFVPGKSYISRSSKNTVLNNSGSKKHSSPLNGFERNINDSPDFIPVAKFPPYIKYQQRHPYDPERMLTMYVRSLPQIPPPIIASYLGLPEPLPLANKRRDIRYSDPRRIQREVSYDFDDMPFIDYIVNRPPLMFHPPFHSVPEFGMNFIEPFYYRR